MDIHFVEYSGTIVSAVVEYISDTLQMQIKGVAQKGVSYLNTIFLGSILVFAHFSGKWKGITQNELRYLERIRTKTYAGCPQKKINI